MKATDCYDFLSREVDSFPFLSHANNILRKKADSKKLDILDKIVVEYVEYYKKNKKITGVEEDVIQKRVEYLNKYYDFLNENNFDNEFSAQSKFRPTILEEFMSILFKDLIISVKEKFPRNAETVNCGSVKAYTNLFFYASNFQTFIDSPCDGVNQKDQDFAIYRKTKLQIDDSGNMNISLPVVAIENKTFIDKTMLEGSIATADKVKSGNPYCLFCIVTEKYDVSMDVDPAYSRIDQIFVLRKCTRRASTIPPIAADVVISLVKLVKDHLERPWSDIRNKLETTGTLI